MIGRLWTLEDYSPFFETKKEPSNSMPDSSYIAVSNSYQERLFTGG